MHSLAPLAYIPCHMPDGLMFPFDSSARQFLSGVDQRYPKKEIEKSKINNASLYLPLILTNPRTTPDQLYLRTATKQENDREKEKRLSYHTLTVAPDGVQLQST